MRLSQLVRQAGIPNWSAIKSGVEGLRLWVERGTSDIAIMRGNTKVGSWWTQQEDRHLYSTHSSLRGALQGRWLGMLGYLLIIELMTKRGGWCASSSTYERGGSSDQALRAWKGLATSGLLRARKIKFGKRTIVVYQYKGPPLRSIIGTRPVLLKPSEALTGWIDKRLSLKEKAVLPFRITLSADNDGDVTVELADETEQTLYAPYVEPLKTLVAKYRQLVDEWKQRIRQWLENKGLRASEQESVEQAILNEDHEVYVLPKGQRDTTVTLRTPSIAVPRPLTHTVKLPVTLYVDVKVAPTGVLKSLTDDLGYPVLYRSKHWSLLAADYYGTAKFGQNDVDVNAKDVAKYLAKPIAELAKTVQPQVDAMLAAYKRSGTDLSLLDWIGNINPLL